MALLPPSLHLTTHLLVDRRLRVDKAFEIERVRYLRLLKPPRRSKGAIHFPFARRERPVASALERGTVMAIRETGAAIRAYFDVL